MPLIVFADERPPLTGRALDLIAHVPRRALDPAAVELAVVASVRHEDTSYDALLMSGVERVCGDVERVLERWRRR